MPDGTDRALTAEIVPQIDHIGRDAWNACAGNANPFVGFDFLAALEDGECVGGHSGWSPQHLLLKDEAGTVMAIAPLYAKSHSYGEYVFDHAWADAWTRAGGQYYPKLQCAAPFSPVPGPRLMVRRDIADPGPVLSGLVAALEMLVERTGVSSAHITFCEQAEAEALAQAGWLVRHGVQFHWENPGGAWENFDDFLAALSSRKRKAIRKERREVGASGIDFVMKRGQDITPDLRDAFYRFYLDTADRKWGPPYLNRAFFDAVAERCGDSCGIIFGFQDDTPVCGALNMIGADTLYGRNWGCSAHAKFLHFEACYYQAIDFALAHGLTRVEAGAQGPHKLQRGYLPRQTYSAHFIPHEGFCTAVSNFLAAEREQVAREIDWLMADSPFRNATHE